MAWQALVLFLSVAPVEQPRLVLLLTIDQGRGDYLERFRPVLTGGLATIQDSGVVFTDAHHRHANTVTAAGHASLATGLFPAHSGVVGNNWYDRSEAREVYCVEDRDSPILPPLDAPRGWRATSGRSPARLAGPSLGDWIKGSVPEARVYSVGGKDRSSILMGGRDPEGVFWYDASGGQWVTSQYYFDAYPEWMQAFQRKRLADEYFGVTWQPLGVETDALSRMEIAASTPRSTSTSAGDPLPFRKTLGRAILTPDAAYYAGLFASPFIESYLVEFAEALVVEEQLGIDDSVDVLALSFSSVDSIGHEFGPNSRELLDAIMRLDRELGRFLEFLDEAVGLSHVAIVLSADHGVAPLPDATNARLSVEDAQCFQSAGRALERRFGKDDWFVEPLHFDYETLQRRNVSRKEIEDFLAGELTACPSIDRVWTRTEIERARSQDGWLDSTLELYVNSFHPDRSPDLVLQLEKFFLARSQGTTHGSPYDYDTHVIAAVMWPGVEPRRVHDRIATVDLSVSVATLLGVPVPGGLDGVDRSELILGQKSPSTR